MSVQREEQKIEFAEVGRGMALFGALLGGLVGAGLYWTQFQSGQVLSSDAFRIAAAAFISTAALAWVFLAERRDFWHPAPLSLLIGVLMAAPTYWYTNMTMSADARLSMFPLIFWMVAAGPVLFHLLTTLAKALALRHGGNDYTAVFFHGLTQPLVSAGALMFLGFGALTFVAWAGLLQSFGGKVPSQAALPTVAVYPILGIVVGFALGVMRGRLTLLSAGRFLTLLLSRWLAPIMAMAAVVLFVVALAKGPESFTTTQYGPLALLGFAIATLFVANGVYQNGLGEKPPALYLSSFVLLLAAGPLIAVGSAMAFTARIETFGLTPPRLTGLGVSASVVLYGIASIPAAMTALNWGQAAWSPYLGRLNLAATGVLAAVLLAANSPLANPWVLSAKSQARMVLSERISIDEIDFSYLRFNLGEYGDEALKLIAAEGTHAAGPRLRTEIALVNAYPTLSAYQAALNGGVLEENEPSTLWTNALNALPLSVTSVVDDSGEEVENN